MHANHRVLVHAKGFVLLTQYCLSPELQLLIWRYWRYVNLLHTNKLLDVEQLLSGSWQLESQGSVIKHKQITEGMLVSCT